ncbi:hypothetical protein GP486_003963, partial [Trichoglossum hirsutum]
MASKSLVFLRGLVVKAARIGAHAGYSGMECICIVTANTPRTASPCYASDESSVPGPCADVIKVLAGTEKNSGGGATV